MSNAEKQGYFAGSDTAGGFGIPADYGGELSEPDPVLEEHNESAKFLRELYNKYEELPDNNIIRKQAEQYLSFYNQTKKLYDKARLLIEKQKAAAGVVHSVLSRIIQLANKRRNEWAAEIANDNTDTVINEIESFVEKSEENINSIISQYEGIEVYDLSVVPIQKLRGLPLGDNIDKSFFAEDGIFDDFLSKLSITLSRLEEISEHGGGIIRINYEALEQQEEKLRQSVDKMQELIQMEIARTKNIDPRLIQEFEQPHKSSVPEDVPNYRLAIDASPRVCGNCKFFEGDEGLHGHCSAFDFTARANYVCDAWQAMPVPSEKSLREGYDIMKKPRSKAEMIYNDGSPKITPGKVPGSSIQPDIDSHSVGWEATDINYSLPQPPDENAALRNAEKQFLPGDVAYSNALRSLVVVKAMGETGRLKYYVVDMIDSNGTKMGSGITMSDDMTPRSSRAVKRNHHLVSTKNDEVDGLGEIISETKSIYRKLKDIVDFHSDVISNPLSNKEVLSPLRESLIKTMEKDVFQNVRTGQKRKYYRALQNALYSVGAARQVLFSGYKTINYIKRLTPNDKTKMRHVMAKSQKDAYVRLKEALKQIEDSLTLPSAMHNTPAPGLKKHRQSKKDLFDAILEQFHNANIAIDDKKKLDEGEYVTQYGYRVWHKVDEEEDENSVLDKMLWAVQDARNLKINGYGTEVKNGALCAYVDIIQVV